VKRDVGFHIVDLESTFYVFIIPLMTIRNLEQLEIFTLKPYVSALSQGEFCPTLVKILHYHGASK